MRLQRKILSMNAVPNEKSKEGVTLFAFCDDGTVWKTNNPVGENAQWEPIDTYGVTMTVYEPPRKK